MEIGYFLSSESTHPRSCCTRRSSQRRRRRFGLDLDHFHPWLDEQGQSAFVWSVIGRSRRRRRCGHHRVTCPTMRIHPAIVARPRRPRPCCSTGRFELGVGSGENLNEHIFGDAWPVTDQRLDMLEEAVEVMRELWSARR
jgi:G6PDH family F420-dependent oxidoreductase